MAATNSEPGKDSNNTRKFYDTGLGKPRPTAVAQAVSVALIASIAPGSLFAQDQPLDEIIVSATKRAESVMDVPIAITAMTGEAIREANLNDVKDLIQFTPGVSGNSKDSFIDFVSIRGIRTIDFGNGGDPSVSFYKNGLYQGRTGSVVSSLYDIERSEVLRGPQGFLYGRGSIAGAMNIITAKPDFDETGGYVELDAGERGVLVFEGAVNIPTSDNFALRLSGYHSEEDGYVENLAGGPDLIAHDKDAFRLSARYQTDKATVDFFTEIEDREQTGTVYRQTGQGLAFEVGQLNMLGGVQAEVSPDGRTVNNDNGLEPIDVADITSFGLEIEYELDNLTFTSLTGFKDHEYEYVEDFDASPVALFMYGQDQEGDYFEQEFRLTSNTDGPLSWYAGVSYYEEDIDTTFLGQQSEDAYCSGYWGYYANLAYPGDYATCESVVDYYNYLGPPDPDYWNAYYAYYYLGATGTLGDAAYAFTPSADGLMNDRNRIIGKYKGYSAYLDLSYEFSETFDISLGVRYSYDEKEFSQEVLEDPGGTGISYRVQTGFSTSAGPLRGKEDWSDVTYRLVGNWHVGESSLIYGSVTEGYKPGGFGSFTADGPSCDNDTPWGLCDRIAGVDGPDTFGPETVTSFEVGYKGTVNNGRTQISASAFFYDYEDMQALFEEGARQVIDNVGQIDGQGFEAEVRTALGDNVNLQLGLSWFDSEATGVQKFCGNGAFLTRDDLFDHEDPGDENVCEGESIPWAPEWTAFAVLKANFPTGNGEVFSNLAWSWEEDYRGDWIPRSLAFQRIAALNQTDFVVGYRAENWSVRAYVENVFDNNWYDGNYPDETDPLAVYTQHAFGPSRPRTSGVRFSYEF